MTEIEFTQQLLRQAIEANHEMVTQWREAHEQVHQAEHQAVVKAEQFVREKLEAMNELRAQINSERGRYVAKDQYEERHEALGQRVSLEIERLSQRVQLMWDGIDRRLSEVERLQTAQQATAEYAKGQTQNLLVKWGLIITAISTALMIAINLIIREWH
jgi:hypothetical protein